jgi:hypothetical protein
MEATIVQASMNHNDLQKKKSKEIYSECILCRINGAIYCPIVCVRSNSADN